MRVAITALTLAWTEIVALRTRALYLILTLAVAVAAWLGLAALAGPFVGVEAFRGSGVIITNARQGRQLPRHYADRIAAIPGAKDVSYITLQIVICKRSPEITATLNAYGGPGTHGQLAALNVTTKLEARWNADPLGILVGAKLAADCGWRAGIGITPLDVMGRPLDLHITGIYNDGSNDGGVVAIAHYDYINRVAALMGQDKVFYITARTANPRGDNALAARIEAAFAYDDPPVEADADSTTENGWARFGKVQYLLGLVIVAVFACAALVLVSVFAHAAAQRRARMATLQAFGFPRGVLLGSFVLEGTLIIIAGFALGAVVGWYALRALTRNVELLKLFGGLSIPAWAWMWLPVWLGALLLAALLAPALTIARLRPIDYRSV